MITSVVTTSAYSYRLLGILCSILIVLGGLSQAQSSNRYRVAVLDLDVTDLSATITNPADLGRAMSIALETPLVQSQRFTVITRTDLAAVLDELSLGMQGVLNPAQVQQLGQLSGAEVIITGDIVVSQNLAMTINAKFISVLTGEVSAAANTTVASAELFPQAAQQLVAVGAEQFPQQGTIIAVDERIFIDLGSSTGLTGNNNTGIIYRQSLIAGRSFTEPVGTFEVLQIGPEASSIAVTMAENMQPQIGDIVTIQALGERLFAPLTNNSESGTAGTTLSANMTFIPSLPACSNPDEVITISDVALAEVISESLGHTSPFTCADMQGLEGLYADSRDISSLVGLEHAINMSWLALVNNRLSDLTPLAGLSQLESLELWDNTIEDVSPLSALTELTTLNLNNNRVRDMSPLASLSKLESLALAGNGLRDISPLAVLTQLRTLDLDYNEISDISSLGSLTSLEQLELSNNRIRDISPLSQLALDSLSLGSNQLDNVADLSQMTSLSYLDIEYNSLKDISSLTLLGNLYGISLSGNDLKDISILANNPRLEVLYMWENQLSDLSPLAELENLSILYLANNRISDISSLANKDYLREVHLSYNAINDLSPLFQNDLSNLYLLNIEALDVDYQDARLISFVESLRAQGTEVMSGP